MSMAFCTPGKGATAASDPSCLWHTKVREVVERMQSWSLRAFVSRLQMWYL